MFCRLFIATTLLSLNINSNECIQAVLDGYGFRIMRKPREQNNCVNWERDVFPSVTIPDVPAKNRSCDYVNMKYEHTCVSKFKHATLSHESPRIRYLPTDFLQPALQRPIYYSSPIQAAYCSHGHGFCSNAPSLLLVSIHALKTNLNYLLPLSHQSP
jgi:hypothetical protein